MAVRMLLRDLVVRVFAVLVLVSCTFQFTGAAERLTATQTFRTVTVEDLEAMRTALLEYLRGSALDDREALLRLTESSNATIDSGDSKRIGLWRLSAESKGMFLQLRTAGDERMTVNYRAAIERLNEEWRVTGIKTQFIHGRR